jgi:transcription antitermination factor NusG
MLIDPQETRAVWLLLRTKSKQERAVAEALVGRGVETYLPRVVEPRWHARAPVGPVPLFPSYVFAHCAPCERFAAVHYCPGATGLVRFGGALAAIEDEIIVSLKEGEGERGYLVIGEVRREPKKGSRVRVVKGPLAGFEGIVERYMPASDRVRLLLALVRSARSVEVDAGHIQPL